MERGGYVSHWSVTKSQPFSTLSLSDLLLSEGFTEASLFPFYNPAIKAPTSSVFQ